MLTDRKGKDEAKVVKVYVYVSACLPLSKDRGPRAQNYGGSR